MRVCSVWISHHVIFAVDVLKLCSKLGFVWTLIADNIDIMTRVKMMSKKNKNKFLHFFHVIATLSRIPSQGRDDVACGDMKDYKFLGAVPNTAEFDWMCDVAFSSMIGRQLQPRLAFMREMQHCVVTSIDHAEFARSCEKTHEVCSLPVSNCVFDVLCTWRES